MPLSDNEPKSKLDQFVQEISKNIPLILDSPLELAIQSLELAMKLAKDKKCKEAYTHFVIVLGKAFEALEHSDHQEKKIMKFRYAIASAKMIILATVAKKTFNGGKILPLYSLDRSQLNVISTELVKIVQTIFEQNKRNKFDSFLFEKLHPEKMTEVNSLVNSILQVCYHS